jgi:hypothetical protein
LVLPEAAQKLKLPGSTDFGTQNFLRKRVDFKQKYIAFFKAVTPYVKPWQIMHLTLEASRTVTDKHWQ